MLLAICFLFAALLRDPFVSTTLEQEPQMVSVEEVLLTSGDLSLTQYDVVVEGIEPILLSSHYFSGKASDPNGGWSIVPQQNLILNTNLRKTEEGKHGQKDWISLAEPHGAVLNYYCSKDDRDVFSVEKGKTSNLWQGKLSSKTNLSNQKIQRIKHEEFIVHCADGGERHYRLRNKKFENEDRRIYHLEKEIKLNGNRIVYEYDNLGRIKSITAKSLDEKKEYARVTFAYDGGKWWEKEGYVIGCTHFSMDTSDGRHFDYYFDEAFDDTRVKGPENAPRYLLSRIVSPFQAETKSQYAPKKGKFYLKSCSSQGGPALAASYKDEQIEHLKAPVGPKDAEKIVSQFSYEAEKTTISDSLGGITVFHYDELKRPLKIKRSDQGGSTEFYWVQGMIPDERIRIKTFSDQTGEKIWARSFKYDLSGNVIGELFAGNLTGNSHAPVLSDLRDKKESLFILGQVLQHPNPFSYKLHCKLVEKTDKGYKSHPDFLEWDQSFTTADGIAFKSHEGASLTCLGVNKQAMIFQPSPVFFENFSIPILDQNGSEVCTTLYDYDNNGRMIRCIEANHRVTLFSYLEDTDLMTSRLTADGSQSAITIVDGQIKTESILKVLRREFFEYDANRILIRKIEDNGSGRLIDDYMGVTIRKIETIEPNHIGNPSKIEEWYWDGKKERLLRRTRFEYFPDGNIKTKEVLDADEKSQYTLFYEYEGGRLISETNPLGEKAEYKYEDAQKNRTYVKDFSGVATTYYYNASNQVIEEKCGNRKIEFRYDDKHCQTGTIDARGNETKQILNPWGHLISLKAADAAETVFTNDPFGNPLTKTSPADRLTETDYNARGQPIEIRYPDGQKKQFRYDLYGNLASELDEEDLETRYTHDVLGNIIQKVKVKNNKVLAWESFVYNGFEISSHRDFEGNVTTFQYDGVGRKIAETCGKFHLEFTYDSLGRQSSIINGKHVHCFKYNLLDQVIEEMDEDLSGKIHTKVQYEYDAAANRTVVHRFIDGNESIESEEFDSFNRQILTTDPYGHSTTIEYNDAFINENGEKVLQKTTTDPLGVQTIETYDIRNRLALWQRSTFKEKYEYDEEGQLIRQVSENPAIETRWAYDDRGRLKMLTEAYGTPFARTTNYSYTPSGKLLTVTKPSAIFLTYTYDDLGFLFSLTSSDLAIRYIYEHDKLGRLKKATDLNTMASTEREYDAKGRLLTETLPSGLSFSSKYDAQGRRWEFTIPDGSIATYAYGPVFLDSISYADQKAAYGQYDLSGRSRETRLPNGVILNTAYDLLGRETSLNSPYFSQSILELDSLSRVAKRSDGSVFFYDDFGHLTSDNVHTYAFDPFGFRLAKDDEKLESNPLHQLPIEYDLDGNPKTHGAFALTFDPLGRLVRLESHDQTLAYEYDALHRRIAKTTNGKRVLYLYDDQNEIGSALSSKQIVELRILKPSSKAEIGASAIILIDGEFYTPLHDLTGNISALVNSSGQISMQASYTPYGEETLAGPISTPWRFASKRVDPETDLVYFGRRFYDPKGGRFITPDPKGFTSGLNLYLFCSNDPLHQFDLYGLESEKTTFASSLSGFSMGYFHGCLDCTPIAWLDVGTSGFNLLSSYKWSHLKKDWRLAIPGDVLKSYIDPLFMPEQQGYAYKTSYWSGYSSGVVSMTAATAGGALLLFTASKASKLGLRTLLAKQLEKQALKRDVGGAVKNGMQNIENVTELLIKETKQAKGRFTSQYKPNTSQVLEAAEMFLGNNYTEIGKKGSGIFRSYDGLRQFRMDANSLLGKHDPYLPHVHFEIFEPQNLKHPFTNNHILLME